MSQLMLEELARDESVRLKRTGRRLAWPEHVAIVILSLVCGVAVGVWL